MAEILPGNGQFILYPNIPPALQAGSYKLTATQSVATDGHAESEHPVDAMNVHIDVRSPRLVMPPDQVLSTYPPAESDGAYGSRLPQVVIKRRTLPWERQLAGAPALTPWMALVVIAEGEGALIPNVPAAQSVTPGVTLTGAVDTEIANCLEIRQSMVDKLFPTRKDVPLLAHARHVDISDTELMMGDDDGFLAVVVANRLPVSGLDAAGNEIPVKYTACLVNLEQQFTRLIPTAPLRLLFTTLVGAEMQVQLSASQMDKHLMGGQTTFAETAGRLRRAPRDNVRETRLFADEQADVASALQAVTTTGFSQQNATKLGRASAVAGSLATESLMTEVFNTLVDPMLRFPVLMHWRFTSAGGTTFRNLMETLDSGLLGTIGGAEGEAPAPVIGRLPLELVDTGHVGIEQRTRRGDSVRAWYRGPFVPHPTESSAATRLVLAHAADQLRIVIPDGREDLSLASAFEIGRLLALANPNMIAALLRWRQLHYATVRRTTVWHANADLLNALDGFVLTERVTAQIATDLGRTIMRAVSAAPTEFFGAPRALVDAGRSLPFEGSANSLLSRAFGLPTLRGTPANVLKVLQDSPVRVAPVTDRVGRVPGGGFVELDRVLLDRALESRVERLVTDVGPQLRQAKKTGARRAKTAPRRDALDEMIERLARTSSTEDVE
jgi:hypothetical protein